jgi:hypothetical protein
MAKTKGAKEKPLSKSAIILEVTEAVGDGILRKHVN